MIKKSITFFDFIHEKWESQEAARFVSYGLVITYIGAIVLFLMQKLGIFSSIISYHTIISLPFSILLLIEMVSFVFTIPYSIADSIGKQMEILCLIFLRASFKEFSKIELPMIWEKSQEQIIKMLSDGCGAMLIFALIGYYYSLQKHTPVTSSKEEQLRFVNQRKIIALGLFLMFFCLGFNDLMNYFNTHIAKQSFNTFYTILVFADILIVLVAIKYTHKFQDIFRYSVFVFVTIMIRISLTAPKYFGILMAIIAVMIAVFATICYNYYLKKINTLGNQTAE